MPRSAYPTLRDRELVPATQRDEGFPNIPGYPFQGNQINYAEKFNFGPRYRLSRRDRHHHDPAAAGRTGAADLCGSGRFRRQ
ncbi:MAG: hypothetical protein WDN69_02825 [Aliidongia sp.]